MGFSGRIATTRMSTPGVLTFASLAVGESNTNAAKYVFKMGYLRDFQQKGTIGRHSSPLLVRLISQVAVVLLL